MKVLKINEVDGIALLAAIKSLAANKQIKNDADKAIEAAKEVIARELVTLRNVQIDTLPEGETLIVELEKGGLKVDRRGKDAIDIKGLRALAPDVAAKFTVRPVASYFEPIG